GQSDIGNVFVWADPRRDVVPRSERPAILHSAFEGAGGAIEKVLKQCPSGEDIYMDALMQIEAKTWHTKRVVLVGDAAHCLTLFSGRGAGAAVNGGMRVAQALADLPVSEALELYEKETRPVIDDIQPATRAAVGWYVPRNRFRQFVRNNAMRFLPNAVFVNYFHRKYTNI
ncbi:MAG: FAD-dependent monooxygenase, partial [Proteobacteria bacterium]|nr:FAD-dependent monooxygenase [Pseudomonadota bacterium]